VVLIGCCLFHRRFRSCGLTGSPPAHICNLPITELYVVCSPCAVLVAFSQRNVPNHRALFDNALSGSLPPEWGDCTTLQRLRLQMNGFVGGIPPEWSTLSSLQQLWVNSNGLSGELPAFLDTFRSLSSLRAFENSFEGQLPSLGNTSLTELLVSDNQLTGTLPPEIGALSSTLTKVSVPVPPLPMLVGCLTVCRLA